MARKRASMREGPLAELFRKTEAAQRAQESGEAAADEPPTVESVEPPSFERRRAAALEKTVEHVHEFADEPSHAGAEPTSPEPASGRSLPAEERGPTLAAAAEPEAAASRAAARYFQTMLEPAPRLHRRP